MEPNARNTRTVTLLNPGGSEISMKHLFRRNPPEDGYLKTAGRMLGIVGVAIVGAGAASYAVARFAGTKGEGFQDAVIGLGGFGIGAALMLIGTPGKIRSSVGLGIAAGTGTLAALRYGAYKLGGAAVAAALDAEREAMARSYASASGVYGAGGVPLSPSTYYGWQGGMASLPAGVPLSPSTYTSMGVMAS